MYFCLRIDLDYVPWDTPDAKEFGHGEPAMLLRILELARHTGLKFHFFASNRVLRAFPANADAVLNDGHDLDWFCKHLETPGARYEEAKEQFDALGHVPVGFALRTAWPAGVTGFDGIEQMKFVSGPQGPIPKGLILFPVEGKPVREAARTGISTRSWVESTKTQLREAASRNIGLTLPVRPPKLSHLRELLELSTAVGMPIRTLRDILQPPQNAA
jgi:hypothetical protein